MTTGAMDVAFTPIRAVPIAALVYALPHAHAIVSPLIYHHLRSRTRTDNRTTSTRHLSDYTGKSKNTTEQMQMDFLLRM